MLNLIFLLLNCSTYHIRVDVTHNESAPIHLTIDNYSQQQGLSQIRKVPDYLVKCPELILHKSNSEEKTLLHLVKIKDQKTLVACMISSLVYAIEHGNTQGIKVLTEYITSNYNQLCTYDDDFIRLLGQKEAYLNASNQKTPNMPTESLAVNASEASPKITKLGRQYLQQKLEAKEIEITQDTLSKELNGLPYPLYLAATGGDFIGCFKPYVQIPEGIVDVSPRGRTRKINDSHAEEARHLLQKKGKQPEIAARFDISVAALYKYIPGFLKPKTYKKGE